MKLEQAQKIAQELQDELAPWCWRWHIAGSVRRGVPDVGDIEILCIPNTEEVKSSLFETETVRIRGFVEALNQFERIKGKSDGKYVQCRHPEGIKLDMFMPAAHDYFRQLAIRTGPAKYSWQMLASTWSRMGWCGTPDGLRLQAECYKLNGGRWNCKVPDPTLPPEWKSEVEFFEWLGIKYVKPTERNA